MCSLVANQRQKTPFKSNIGTKSLEVWGKKIRKLKKSQSQRLITEQTSTHQTSELSENKTAECAMNTDNQAMPLAGERRTSGFHSGLIATCGSVTREGLLLPPLCSSTQDNEAP